MGNLYIPLIVIDRASRKIYKNIEVMNSIMNQLELLDIHRVLDLQLQNALLFSSAYGIVTKRDLMQCHKTTLNKLNHVEYIL